MLQEQPVQYGPLGDDGDGINRAWPVEKRRRKCSPPSSSNAPAAQDNQDPISPATDMEGIIKDNHLPLDTSDPEQQENEQEIWGPDVEISPEDAANYTKCLAPDIPPIYKRSSMTTEEEEDLNLRLARYRIAYYKNVAEPELARKLKDPEDYSVEELQENRYFLHFDTHPSFEGCFHPVDTWVAELNDYQRLLVFNGSRDCSDSLYIYWEDYHAYYHTYEVDDAYVKFYGELSSKIKWIKEHVDLDENSEKWEEVGTRAGRQALRIASRFANLSASLVRMAFYEYISELREDKVVEDWSLFYFEVWKLNALKKGSLRDAVKEAYEMDKFGFECERMDAESNATSISFFEQKFKFLASEGGITENTKEGEVLDLFRKIVIKKLKPKNMAMYAQKKLEIAKLMKLIPRPLASSAPPLASSAHDPPPPRTIHLSSAPPPASSSASADVYGGATCPRSSSAAADGYGGATFPVSSTSTVAAPAGPRSDGSKSVLDGQFVGYGKELMKAAWHILSYLMGFYCPTYFVIYVLELTKAAGYMLLSLGEENNIHDRCSKNFVQAGHMLKNKVEERGRCYFSC